jgi:ribokinase
MTVFNLGSINVDRFYRVPHLPRPGETLPATAHEVGLGGKGANQSVAVARAGSAVRHIGMIGNDNGWVRERLAGFGVDVTHIGACDGHTGHAIIIVDDAGENAIVTFAGSNYHQSTAVIATALNGARKGDIFMFQNEVSDKPLAARIAREKEMFVVYSAAPFKPEVVGELLPFVDLLVLNEIEAGQLSEALGLPVEGIPVPHLLLTRGAEGAIWREQKTGDETAVPSIKVDPVDTAGAGDCFIGYVIAGLDQGLVRADALRLGAAAAALQVTRKGTADAIPDRAEVDAFLAGTVTA